MIKDAPLSVVVICLVALGVTHFMYTGQIGSARDRLKDAQDDTKHWHETADFYKDLASRPTQTAEVVSTKARPSGRRSSDPPKKPEPEKKPPDSSSSGKQKASDVPAVIAPNGVAIGRDNSGIAIVNNIGTLPRTLSPEQQAAIASRVGPQPSGFTGVTCLLGDQEGCSFATQVMATLRTAGWKIDGLSQSVMTEHLEGVFLAIAPDDVARPPSEALSLYNTLRFAGIPIQGLKMNGTTAGKFEILVAAHTKP